MGSNPVWRASGHDRACRRSGASLDTARLESPRAVEGSDAINPQRWENGGSQREPPWLMDSGIPWRRVILMSPHQATDSRTDRDERGSQRDPIFVAPLFGRYSGRQVMVARHTRAYVECTQSVRRTYAERTQAYAVRSIDSHDFFDCLFVAGFSEDFTLVKVPPLRVLARPEQPVPLPRWGSPSC